MTSPLGNRNMVPTPEVVGKEIWVHVPLRAGAAPDWAELFDEASAGLGEEGLRPATEGPTTGASAPLLRTRRSSSGSKNNRGRCEGRRRPGGRSANRDARRFHCFHFSENNMGKTSGEVRPS